MTPRHLNRSGCLRHSAAELACLLSAGFAGRALDLDGTKRLLACPSRASEIGELHEMRRDAEDALFPALNRCIREVAAAAVKNAQLDAGAGQSIVDALQSLGRLADAIHALPHDQDAAPGASSLDRE